MAAHSSPTDPDAPLTGQRSVRFEADGPGADAVMTMLRSSPPIEIAGQVVTEADVVADRLVLGLPTGHVTVRAGDTDRELIISGEFWGSAPHDASGAAGPAAHDQVSAVLNALTSLVADPERSRARDQLDTGAADASVETQATVLFAREPQELTRAEALRLVIDSIDLTTLAGDDTPGRVRALCALARRPDPADPGVGPTAAVCVYPNLVRVAVELTKDSGVAVASVAGAFPSGLSSLEVRLSDIAEAVCAGADEIDVVLNRSAFLAGDYQLVSDELQAMRAQIGPRSMKVILETSELESVAAIRRATTLAMRAGADWVKTSTGKSSQGATPTAVLAMTQAVDQYRRADGAPVGIKISGGVRTSAEALGYLAIVEHVLGPAWLDPTRVRFGASALLTTVVKDLGATAQADN